MMPVPADWARRYQFVRKGHGYDPFAADQVAPFLVFDEMVESPESFRAWASELDGEWCFRGHQEAHWPLQTAFDRAVREQTPFGEFLFDPTDSVEPSSIQCWTRRAKLPTGSWAERLALMQHHNVQTRLLDFTRNPLVALYFALERESSEGHSAVWAIDLEWLERSAASRLALPYPLNLTAAEVDRLLLDKTDRPVVFPIPPRPGARISAQQGLLLAKLVRNVHFNKVLASMFFNSPPPERPVIRRIRIPIRARPRLVDFLCDAGVTKDVLFPGAELDAIGVKVRQGQLLRIGESIQEAREAWDRVGKRLLGL